MSRRMLVLALLLAACSKTDAGEGATGPSAPAAVDKAVIEQIEAADPGEVTEMTRDLLSEVTAILKGVTDVDSAKSAAPKIEALAQRVDPLRERRDQLAGTGAQAGDKLAMGQAAMAMLGEITTLGEEFERLESVPGVREALEGPMSKVMAFFDPDAGK